MEWKPVAPDPARYEIKDSRARGGFQLMTQSLLSSTTFDAINYRLRNGLAAQRLLKGWASLELSSYHWTAEAQYLFETSLARIQVNARDIAQGSGYVYAKYKQHVPDLALCDKTFMFMSNGWQNVQVAGSIWILVLAFLAILLAFPLFDGRLFVQLLPELYFRTIPLLVEALYRAIIGFLSRRVPKLFETAVEFCRRLSVHLRRGTAR